jgi:8-oxo-dGTP pyrophosphatase MutT (NUDIX family)
LTRHTRYQGAIINNDHILLIRHRQHATGRTYWVIPGGGIGEDESEEACIVREMKEETNLDVEVERLLLDEPCHPDGVYEWSKTFLCRPIAGVASPGYEPEPEAAAEYSITEVRWFDLRDEATWGEAIKHDPFTYPQLVSLREVLGYTN